MAWSRSWIAASSLAGLLLGIAACDQAPAEAKPSAPVVAPVEAPPAVDSKAAVVVPVDPPPPAPTTAVIEPDVVPVVAPGPIEVVTPSGPSEPTTVDELDDEQGKDPASPPSGPRTKTKKGGPAKVEAFTDCQRQETFADGHCYASHQAACEALGCSGQCLSLKSMPAQAKCL